MVATNLYICVDSMAPKVTRKQYGYVIEMISRGETITREGFGSATGTYHNVTLTALAEALGRYTAPCEVTVHSEDDFVLTMLESSLERWAQEGFLTSLRKPIKNQEEWRKVWERSRNLLLLTAVGRHSYTEWLMLEMEKRKESNDVI